MINIDKIKSMNMEELATRNVYGINLNIGCRLALLYITSDGFQTEDKDEAIDHELNWLKNE